MKKAIAPALVLALTILAGSAGSVRTTSEAFVEGIAAAPAFPDFPAGVKDRNYKFEAKEDIRKSFPMADPALPAELFIDNIFGGINVRAADVASVELSVRKTIKTTTQDRIAKAKTEVDLKITQKGNTVDLFVDGPFRDEERKRRGTRWNDPGYIVVYEFTVKVPHRTRLGLKTVTEGDIAVHGVDGGFDISHVNGQVTLDGIVGAGEAETVSGDVKAVFTRNPGAVCAFKTVSGDVDLSLRDGLAADLRLKSMTGEALSDFAVTPLPDEPIKSEKHGGRTVYSRGGFTGVRIGKGGPEIRCETFSGDILIRKSK
jgi:hypothetical protein